MTKLILADPSKKLYRNPMSIEMLNQGKQTTTGSPGIAVTGLSKLRKN